MKNKLCTKCNKIKTLSEFHKDKSRSDGYHYVCKKCKLDLCNIYDKNKTIRLPWYNSYKGAKSRCNCINHVSYKNYGGRGIKFLMTLDDFEFLWFRDKAYEMKRPSIDRIDKDGHYKLSNCQFIELSENTKKSFLDNPRGKSVLQFNLMGVFIKEWPSLNKAGISCNGFSASVAYAIEHKIPIYGYIWKFKEQ